MNLKKYLPLFIVSFIISCSSDDSSELQLSIQGNTAILQKAIRVEMTSGGWSKTLYGADFGNYDSQVHSQSFVTPISGNIRIRFTLSDTTGVDLNFGTIALDAKPDWRWSVDFVLSSSNPFNSCFGCIGYSAFSVDSIFQTSNRDSLFVIWGGNSIKNPVIY